MWPLHHFGCPRGVLSTLMMMAMMKETVTTPLIYCILVLHLFRVFYAY